MLHCPLSVKSLLPRPLSPQGQGCPSGDDNGDDDSDGDAYSDDSDGDDYSDDSDGDDGSPLY